MPLSEGMRWRQQEHPGEPGQEPRCRLSDALSAGVGRYASELRIEIAPRGGAHGGRAAWTRPRARPPFSRRETHPTAEIRQTIPTVGLLTYDRTVTGCRQGAIGWVLRNQRCGGI